MDIFVNDLCSEDGFYCPSCETFIYNFNSYLNDVDNDLIIYNQIDNNGNTDNIEEFNAFDNKMIYNSYKSNMKHTYENSFYNNKYKSKIIKCKIIQRRKNNNKIKNKRITKEINSLVSKHCSKVIV